MTHPTPSALRALIEAEASRELSDLRYREPPMLAHGLRKLLGEDLKKLPEGMLIEDKRDHAGPEDRNRLRITSQSLPYINDLRRAIMLERWCDQVLVCSPQDGAREVGLMWKGPQQFEDALSASHVNQMQEGEGRLVSVLHNTAAALENGDDYLVVLWNWVRTRSLQDPEGRPRIVQVTNRPLVESLCQTLLSRDLVLPDEIDDLLRSAGLSAVRARLKPNTSKTPSEDATEDLLEPKEAAKLLGITVATLNNKKSQGDLPASVYVQPSGSRIKYRRKALLAWHRGQSSAPRRRR